MDLIVHIGTPKTGTTSIQEALFKNKEVLASHGFHFLQCAGERNNRKLAVYCLDPDTQDDYYILENITSIDEKKRFNDRFYSDFIEEMNSLGSGIHTVLMSSVRKFCDLVSPYFAGIKVLCYLREQCDAVSSLYTSAMKVGQRLTFDSFLSRYHPDNPRFNYFEMINRWALIFGRQSIVIKKYSKKELFEGDLVRDYFHSVYPDLVNIVEENRTYLNTSISPFGQALLLSLNHYLPKNKVIKHYRDKLPLRGRLMRAIATSFSGRGLQATEEQYKAIYDSFYQSNKDLNNKYLGKNDKLFEYFPPVGKSDRSKCRGFTFWGYCKFTILYIYAYSSFFKGSIDYCKFMMFHFFRK